MPNANTNTNITKPLFLRMPNKHLAVQWIDIGFKQMWSRCLCRIQGVRMPMGRIPIRFKSITPMIVMLVAGQDAHECSSHRFWINIRHKGQTHRGVQKGPHTHTPQPGSTIHTWGWTTFLILNDHPIKLFTRIWVFSLWRNWPLLYYLLSRIFTKIQGQRSSPSEL